VPSENSATLETAIEQAVVEHKKELPKQDVSESEVKESVVEDTKEPEPEPELDEEVEQGRALVQALKDPTKAPLIIDYLARQAGYSKTEIETKKDVKEAARSVQAILEESLGEDFKFLAPKLAPAIEKVLETHRIDNSDTDNIKERLDRAELREIQNETTQTHVAISQEWFGSDDMPDNVVKAMGLAMDEFPPTDPNMAPARYYRRIFSLVAGELGLQKKTQSTRDRAAANRKDETARTLSQNNRGVTPEGSGKTPRKMNLTESISLALEQVDKATK
jgi:hypothetical protein